MEGVDSCWLLFAGRRGSFTFIVPIIDETTNCSFYILYGAQVRWNSRRWMLVFLACGERGHTKMASAGNPRNWRTCIGIVYFLGAHSYTKWRFDTAALWRDVTAWRNIIATFSNTTGASHAGTILPGAAAIVSVGLKDVQSHQIIRAIGEDNMDSSHGDFPPGAADNNSCTRLQQAIWSGESPLESTPLLPRQ
jgi:hypothetical protein